MALPDDILAKIRQDFSGGEMLPVIELLTDLWKEDSRLFTDRILRCILFLARGSFDELADAVALARHDPRDLIVGAEYEGHFGARQRDLSSPYGRVADHREVVGFVGSGDEFSLNLVQGTGARRSFGLGNGSFAHAQTWSQGSTSTLPKMCAIPQGNSNAGF